MPTQPEDCKHYVFGDFRLDASQRALFHKAELISLALKSLETLLFMVQRHGRIVEKHELMKALWPDAFVEEGNLARNISTLRKILSDTDNGQLFIETIPKRGYRFVAPVRVLNGEDATQSSDTLLMPVEATLNVSTQEPASADPLDSIAQSIEASPQVSGAPRVPTRSLLRTVALALLASTVLLGLGLWFFQMRAQRSHPVEIHSLAVLPLQNLSPDPGQDYFADGITEELITNLAQSLPLRVISRTSVMRYKQTKEPINHIARELGVEAIVEGAVARSGDRVTVTVQLIDATEDRHLWAHKYERNFEDVLALEAEVSQEVAKQVGGKLSPQLDAKAAKPRAVDPQVYELCLMGRFHWNKRTAADLARSADYYQQAIARDPAYAPAYAGLASAYALMPSYDSVGMRDTFAKAEAATLHALALDDSLAEAHATLALIRLNKTPDWMHTEPEFRRALELNPSYATAHDWYAYYLLSSGRRGEALTEMEEARKLDPLSAIINADEGDLLYNFHRDAEARARLTQAIELAPDLGQPYLTLAFLEIAEGHQPDALKEARTALALDPTNPQTIAGAAYVLAVTGQTGDATRLLATLKDLTHHGAALPHLTALVQMGLGKRDEAFDSLEEMKNSKLGAGLSGLPQWRVFDELKTDPRYQKLLADRPRESH